MKQENEIFFSFSIAAINKCTRISSLFCSDSDTSGGFGARVLFDGGGEFIARWPSLALATGRKWQPRTDGSTSSLWLEPSAELWSLKLTLNWDLPQCFGFDNYGASRVCELHITRSAPVDLHKHKLPLVKDHDAFRSSSDRWTRLEQRDLVSYLSKIYPVNFYFFIFLVSSSLSTQGSRPVIHGFSLRSRAVCSAIFKAAQKNL